MHLIHKWEYFDTTDGYFFMRERVPFKVREYRRCGKCGKVQQYLKLPGFWRGLNKEETDIFNRRKRIYERETDKDVSLTYTVRVSSPGYICSAPLRFLTGRQFMNLSPRRFKDMVREDIRTVGRLIERQSQQGDDDND